MTMSSPAVSEVCTGTSEVSVTAVSSCTASSAAAPPPTALNSDTSCGIAVIFTVRAAYSPAAPPTAKPTAATAHPVPVIWPRTAISTTVDRIATAIAIIDT